MRLTRISNTSDLIACLKSARGQFLLMGVTFGDADEEVIRLNVTQNGVTYWRASTGRHTFALDPISVAKAPFHVGAHSLLLSFQQLRQWQENFAFVHECLGANSLGNVPANDPVGLETLAKLQAIANEISRSDALLGSIDVKTPLLQFFEESGESIELYRHGTLTEVGQSLLQLVSGAAAVYERIPELRSFFSDRSHRRVENLSGAGHRFRQWHSEHPLAISEGRELRFVDDELKPLHLTGSVFNWTGSGEDDIRLKSVDILSECKGSPVWCEVKMQGDTWTSSALVQILLYGTMIASQDQQKRLQRKYDGRFGATRPWLGVIVEERSSERFASDRSQAIAFCRDASVAKAFGSIFEGVYIITVVADPVGESRWSVRCAEAMDWRPA